MNDFLGFQLLSLVYISAFVLLSARIGNRLAGTDSPVKILAASFAKVVFRHWNRLRPHLSDLAENPVHLIQLQTALAYLSARSTGTYTLERERTMSRAHYADLSANKQQPDSTVSSPVWETVSDVLLAVLVALMVGGILVALLLLLQQWPLESSVGIGLVALLIWLTTRPNTTQLEYVPVIGLDSAWYQPRSSKEFDEERRIVYMAIVDKGVGIGTSETSEVSTRDLSEAKNTSLPAPPGITELALSSYPDMLAEVKDELLALKRWHRIVFGGVFTLFILVVIGGIFANILFFKNGINATLGGVGFAGVVGGMLWGFLPSLRTSHIALALYHSYQIELVKNLALAAAASSSHKRLRLEAQAWDRFRTGLNGLWMQESKSRSSSPIQKSSSKRNKRTGINNKSGQ